MSHARYLYDMLIPFTPVFSALSQATPIFKGKLSDYDFRWETIEMGTDDRTKEERDPKSDKYIHKTRYSTVSHYLSNHQYATDDVNDTCILPVCAKIMNELQAGGVDKRLAYHVATMLIRSPVPAYSTEIDLEEMEKIREQIKQQKVLLQDTKKLDDSPDHITGKEKEETKESDSEK